MPLNSRMVHQESPPVLSFLLHKWAHNMLSQPPKDSVTPFYYYYYYSSTKQLILKYSISALNNLNVEFLLEFVQKEDTQNLL